MGESILPANDSFPVRRRGVLAVTSNCVVTGRRGTIPFYLPTNQRTSASRQPTMHGRAGTRARIMGWEPRSATGRDGPATTAAIPLEIIARTTPASSREALRGVSGFSLIEVTAAIALVAFAMLAILGLIPVALKASRDAVDDTRASLMAQDAVTHIGSLPSNATKATLWYDGDGRYLGRDTAPPDFTNAMYRADITLGSLGSYPANTSPGTQDPANGASTQLKGAAVIIRWPVNTANGELMANGPNEIKYSFLVRTTP